MTTFLLAATLLAPLVDSQPGGINPGLADSLDKHLQAAESRSGRLRRADIAPNRLAQMGLAGIRVLSDSEASQVRSSPCPVYVWHGGTFRVLIAHALADQYNFLYTSGFAAAAFAPVRAPVGAMGLPPR